MRRPIALLAAVAAILTGTVPAAQAQAVEPWQQTVDITFPAEADKVHFSDTYTACRSGCARIHQATDIMGPKHTKLFATVDGVVCRIDEGAEDSYGRHLTLCGDDGNEYRYLHINNDTPGTDDGAAGLEHVYAPGIRSGVRVARGQFIAYMGDSGNAENSGSHLHFDLYVPSVTNPYGESRINPYHSLMAAIAESDFSDGTAFPVESNERRSGATRVETAVAISQGAFSSAPAAVLATSLSPHDALVGGPLASVLDAPVLITAPDNLDAAVIAELQRLGVSRVVLVGDVAALQSTVERLLPGVTAEVIAGGDVYETAAQVAEHVWEITGAVEHVHDEIEIPEVHDVHEVAPDELSAPSLDFDPMATEAGTPTLVLFENGDRSGLVGDLHGAHLPATLDRLHVSLAGVDPSTVDRVTFHTGESARRDNRINSEKRFPYDLGGSAEGDAITGVRHWWSRSGLQALTAEIRFEDGSRETVTAVFSVGETTEVPSGPSVPDVPQTPARRAILALGGGVDEHRAWPDALAASWYGSVRGMPVLLTRPDAAPAVTAAAVATLDGLVVAGGRAAVSDEQFALLDSLTPVATTRLSGPDRYATAAAIAGDLVSRRLVDSSVVFVATGQNWPDAVAAGPAVAADGNLLLLVDGGAGSSASAQDAVAQRADAIDQVVVLGGRAAISDDTMQRVAGWAL